MAAATGQIRLQPGHLAEILLDCSQKTARLQLQVDLMTHENAHTLATLTEMATQTLENYTSCKGLLEQLSLPSEGGEAQQTLILFRDKLTVQLTELEPTMRLLFNRTVALHIRKGSEELKDTIEKVNTWRENRTGMHRIAASDALFRNLSKRLETIADLKNRSSLEFSEEQQEQIGRIQNAYEVCSSEFVPCKERSILEACDHLIEHKSQFNTMQVEGWREMIETTWEESLRTDFFKAIFKHTTVIPLVPMPQKDANIAYGQAYAFSTPPTTRAALLEVKQSDLDKRVKLLYPTPSEFYCELHTRVFGPELPDAAAREAWARKQGPYLSHIAEAILKEKARVPYLAEGV